MFFKRYGNLVLGIFFMLLAVVYYFLASQLPPSQVMKLGPAFVPKLTACLTFVIALVLTVTSVRKLKQAPASSGPDANEYGRVALTIFAFSAYVVLFDILGFLIATFLYLLVQMPIMAPREKMNIPLFAGIALVTSVGVYCIFKFGLYVMLPAGLIG